VTADRTGAQPLSPAPPVLATQQSPAVLTQIAETVTRFGLPAFILTLPLEVTAVYLRLQLARIVLLVIALAFAYLVVLRRRKVVVPLDASIVVLALFVAYSILSWLVTRAPGSGNPLLDVVAYPVVALLVVGLTRTAKDHDMAWTALLVSAIAMSILGAFLYYTGLSIWRPDPALLGRVNATFGDPNIMGRFLTLGASVAVFIYAGRRQRTWLAVSAAVASATVMPLTFSKSGYLFFAVCAILAAVLSSNWRRGAALAAVILVVFLATLVINPSTRARSLIVIDSIAGTSLGISIPRGQAVAGVRLDDVRTFLIEAGLQMFRDHPVAGVGFGGFQHAIKTTYSGFLPKNPQATLSHTSAVTILAEQGTIGAGLMVVFLLLLAWRVLRAIFRPTAWRDLVVTPAFLVGPILVYSQFEGRFIEEPYLWLALGLLYSAWTLDRSVRAVELPR
jgi:O-antigen ligase